MFLPRSELEKLYIVAERGTSKAEANAERDAGNALPARYVQLGAQKSRQNSTVYKFLSEF